MKSLACEKEESGAVAAEALQTIEGKWMMTSACRKHRRSIVVDQYDCWERKSRAEE